MSKFTGVVSKTVERSYKGKKLYSFFLRGHEGLFKLGETTPKFKEGSTISFEANEALIVEPNSITAAENAPATVVNKEKATATAFVDYRAEADKLRQRNINFQSAHKDAIEVAKFMIDKGFVKMPAKVADQYDVVLALVGELTTKFFNEFAVDHEPETSETETEIKASEEDE